MIAASFRLAARDVVVDLDLPEGSTTVLMGPNGAGKSSLAGMLTGLVRPDPGSLLRVDGADLLTTPTYRRRIGLVAQQPRLFPHRSVLDNVAYAPRAAGVRPAQARQLASELLETFDVHDLAARRADRISGGQAQRVALARALAAQPRLLVLDEPFAGLDVEVAAGVRQALTTSLVGLTCLLISHDPTDALLLGDRLLIMESGRLVESGEPSQVLHHPQSAFAARLAQLNLIEGIGAPGGELETRLGLLTGSTPIPAGATGVAVFEPAAVGVYTERPEGSLRNVVAATVTGLLPTPSGVLLSTAEGVRAELTPGSATDLKLRPGDRVWLGVKAQQVRLSARTSSD